MSLRINHNASAMRTLMAGYQVNRDLSQSIERLSSGLRINRASDDAASLSISENLRAQIRGSHQAIRNAQDFVSLVQIAEGALGDVPQLLQRIRELAVQAANGTLDTTDPFHGWAVDTGTTTTNLAAALGIGAPAANTNTKGSAALAATGGGISVTTLGNAQQTISTVDAALNMVNSQRALLGATQNRLEHTMRSQMIAAENMAAANSRLRDLDFADELTNLTRHQILAQSSTAILAQSNVSSAGMLDLLS